MYHFLANHVSRIYEWIKDNWLETKNWLKYSDKYYLVTALDSILGEISEWKCGFFTVNILNDNVLRLLRVYVSGLYKSVNVDYCVNINAAISASSALLNIKERKCSVIGLYYRPWVGVSLLHTIQTKWGERVSQKQHKGTSKAELLDTTN